MSFRQRITLVSAAAVAVAVAVASVLVYMLTSAQLPTYFVGVQEHLALREEARKRWGRGFTLKRYHDAVLSFGSPPVRYVRELVFDLPIE